MKEILLNIGLAVATAGTMAFSKGEVGPVFASDGQTSASVASASIESNLEINSRDIQVFRRLMGDILNTELNPQIFSENSAADSKFKVRSTEKLAAGIISEKSYSYRLRPSGDTHVDRISVLVSESRDVSYQTFEVSINPDGKVAAADPRVQYQSEDLISGAKKALKNSPDNWMTVDNGDYTESRGSTEEAGIVTNYLLFGDGFCVITRDVPLNH